ncbi:MAG: type II toxin-antitoxin system VapC family toxin [Thermoleophilaceae bacterium]
MIVLDASAAAEILLALPRAAPQLRERLARASETVHVPHVFDLEVIAAIRRHALRGMLSEPRARRALRALDDLRATRYSHEPLRRRIWELRQNVTPYDAAYVALAEALRAPLVTVDAALAGAARPRAEVELHPST